jgi:uncharacterized lipoprotein YmbA
MKTVFRRLLPLFLAVCLASLGACVNILQPRPNNSRFYVLTPITPPENAKPAADAGRSMVIGLGPISLPPYLDREEMVTRIGPNQIAISNHEFWAEPLQRGVSAALGSDLSTLLNNAQIVNFPWYGSTRIDYKIAVNILRFEGEANGTALLVATWTIKGGSSGEMLHAAESKIAEQMGPQRNQATALSQALAEMARQIAAAINSARQPA